MTESALVRIATRGSQLALWQSNSIADQLRLVGPGLRVETVVVRTTGDRVPFHSEDGKGARPKVAHFQMRPDPLAH